MTIHTLEPTKKTLHGAFSPDRPAILEIESGDTIVASVPDAGWGKEAPHLDGTPHATYPKPQSPEQDGHALIGPIAIKGAQPGMTLAVHIEEIVVGDYGYTYTGGFPHRVNRFFDFEGHQKDYLVWALDAENAIGTTQHGQRVRLNPFLGVMGMPPPTAGYHSTQPPRTWGGNIDCKSLIAGTKLYLPIPVEGGLFSFGDGHAAQGHGEVSVTAIECPMERVQLRLEVLADMPLTTPRAWTPEGWLCFGFDEDLQAATFIALDDMLSLMMGKYSLPSRKQALGLATAFVDLHITQIANPAQGVHAFLPHNALL